MPRFGRLPDWQARLTAYLEAARGRPFSWGCVDCCLFACDGVAAMTGTDPAAELRGRYSGPVSAIRELRRFLSEEDASRGVAPAGAVRAPEVDQLLALTAQKIAADLFAPEVPVARAQRGDVVWLPPADDVELMGALGLVALDGRSIEYVSPRPGARRYRLVRAARAWRVPFVQ